MIGKATSMRLRKTWDSPRSALALGVAVIVVFATAVVFGLNATHGMPLAQRKTVKAAFTNVGGLVEGDDVRVASSRVGYVEDILIENGQAVAMLKIDDESMKIYRDASATTASVGARSALGQKFVDLDVGSSGAGELSEHEVIPQRETRGAQEISELFNVFDAPTRKGSATALRELGGGMGGHEKDFSDLLRTAPAALPALGTVSRSLTANGGADLTALLSSADTLVARFHGRQQEMADLTRQLGTTLQAMAVDGGEPLEETLTVSPEALRAARGAFTSLAKPLRDTKIAAAGLRPGAEALGDATADLRGVFTDGVRPLRKVPGVSVKAQPAVTALTGLMGDARPLAQRLVRTLDWSATPLAVLAPYSAEIANFFTAGTNALSQGDGAGHWLRIYVVPRVESVSGVLPIDDPTVNRNAYPAPGQAAQDSAGPVKGGQP